MITLTRKCISTECSFQRCSDQGSKSNEAGASRVTIVVFLALLGAVVYLLSRLLPIYYSYFELENQMESLAIRAEELDDTEIRKRLAAQLDSLKIPATVDEIRIRRTRQQITIDLKYKDWLDIYFGDKRIELWEFDFLAHAESELE